MKSYILQPFGLVCLLLQNVIHHMLRSHSMSSFFKFYSFIIFNFVVGLPGPFFSPHISSQDPETSVPTIAPHGSTATKQVRFFERISCFVCESFEYVDNDVEVVIVDVKIVCKMKRITAMIALYLNEQKHGKK